MCGSTDIIKKDGFYVCNYCGTKYTVEEAKKIFLSSTVTVDKTDSISKYVEIMENAVKSQNYEEAEKYANMILEIDQHNYKAWYYKGLSAGWLSSIKNNRYIEALTCFQKAIENANNTDDIAKLKEKMNSDIFSVSLGMISLAGNMFSKVASLDNRSRIEGYISLVHKNFDGQLFADLAIDRGKMDSEIENRVFTAVSLGETNTIGNYKKLGGSGKVFKLSWNDYIDKLTACQLGYLTCARLSENNHQHLAEVYKRIVFVLNSIKNSYARDAHFTKDGEAVYQKDIDGFTNKIRELEKQDGVKYIDPIQLKKNAAETYQDPNGSETIVFILTVLVIVVALVIRFSH